MLPYIHTLLHVAACMNGSINSPTGKIPQYNASDFEKYLPYDLLLKSPVSVYLVEDYSQNQL